MERTADPPLMRDYKGCGRGEATMRETESQDLGPELLPAKHSSHIPLHAHPFILLYETGVEAAFLHTVTGMCCLSDQGISDVQMFLSDINVITRI
jgi:hypothetical protein